MVDENCIFCKIVSGDMPSTKIYDDQDFIAIFDAFPHVDGQTIVISKNHIPSKYEETPDEVLEQAIILGKKISLNLKKAFNSDRIVEVIEGIHVQHMHLKLFPVENSEKFSLALLNELYPTSGEMLSPEQFNRLKEKYDKVAAQI